MLDQNPKLKSITVVAEELGIKQHVIRFWEKNLPLLKPVIGKGNRRYYAVENVAQLAEIKKLLHEEGYTIKGVSKLLSAVENNHERSLCNGDQYFDLFGNGGNNDRGYNISRQQQDILRKNAEASKSNNNVQSVKKSELEVIFIKLSHIKNMISMKLHTNGVNSKSNVW